jgi:hypothetical protein
MCRRWTGSAFLGVSVPEEDLVFTGSQNIRTRASSSWAERAWCDACGSGLWYRITRDGRFSGSLELPIGRLDDPRGLTVSRARFIDHTPDGYADAGERRRLSRAQVMRLFRVDLDAT